jgi:hypothetical protein
LRDALAYLWDAWPMIATSNSPGGQTTAARLVLTQFFGRSAIWIVLFAKIDGAIANCCWGRRDRRDLDAPVVAALVGIALTLEAAGIADAVPDDEGLKGNSSR